MGVLGVPSVTEKSGSPDMLGNNANSQLILKNWKVIRLNGLFVFIHSNQMMMIIKIWY